MLHEFSRTEILIGKEALEKLKKAKVAIFGLGGVGSFVVEGLVRAGISDFVLIDHDVVSITNINRQLHSTTKTIGKAKTELMKGRIHEINPNANVKTIQKFYLPDNSDEMISEDYDYIVDAIDTVTSKIDLIIKAKERNIPIISCMGAGNKLDPTRFEVADIYDTTICPLAKVIRKELRIRGVESLKVVYSKEVPIKPAKMETPETSNIVKRQVPGSISFVPSVAGLIVAGEVVKDIINDEIYR